MTDLEPVAVTPGGAVPAVRPDQADWTPEQAAALDAIGVGKAPREQQRLFLAQCQRTGLDPFARQIHMIERRSKNKQGQWESKWTIQTGIDGFRLMAERSGVWAGTSEPQWCGEDGQWSDVWLGPGKPAAARVLVYRSDKAMPFVGLCVFTEYDQGNSMWETKPAHQIAKCAEAQAYRKAFPQDMSGLYITEELPAPETRPAVNTARLMPKPVTAERVTPQGGYTNADPETGEILEDDRDARAQTLARIGDLFDAAGITDPDQRLLWVNQELALADMLNGRPVNTAADLTPDQAHAIIERLETLEGAALEGPMGLTP